MIERSECVVYDAEDETERMNAVKKKPRTVFARRPIIITL
jgi:hypothetical protein